MPPKVKISKQEIIDAAVNIVRDDGIDALNARYIAKKLGCSTQPIFSNFASMDEIKNSVIGYAYSVYYRYLEAGKDDKRYPPYKSDGMSYIRFAKEEPKLFGLLFMRDRTGEETQSRELDEIIDRLCGELGLTREAAKKFHLEMWIYVHGIAVMIATSYIKWDEESISSMMTDMYLGMKKRLESEGLV